VSIDNIIQINTINFMLEFASYFIFSFVGSLLKEIHNTNTNENHTFEAYRVVTSTIVASFLDIGIKIYYADMLDTYWGLMAPISLVLGLIGFELFWYLSSITRLKKLLKFITSDEESSTKSTNDDDSNDENNKPKNCINSLEDHKRKVLEYHSTKPVIHYPINHQDDDE